MNRGDLQRPLEITCLFLDIGGVLLTDGWDRHARKRARTHFGFEGGEMENRHHLCFETFEQGKMTLDEYLEQVVFYEERKFSQAKFQEFMFKQSKSHPEMIELFSRLKARHGLKVVAVSNEARELNTYRVRQFMLDSLIDAFVSSCFVHLRKPDTDIFRMALDICQVSAEHVLYIENTDCFVEVAASMGIRGICHTDFKTTKAQLEKFDFEPFAANGGTA